MEEVKQGILCLRDNKLKAKRKIYNFNAQSVEYLGHIVSNGTMAMDPTKIFAV